MSPFYGILRDVFQGLWHSTRGFYCWYFYDASPSPPVAEQVSSITPASSLQDVSLPADNGAGVVPQKKSTHRASTSASSRLTVKETLFIALKYNTLLTLCHLCIIIIDLMVHRVLQSQRLLWHWCVLNDWLLHLLVVASNLICIKCFNIQFQNQIATQVYTRTLGRAKELDWSGVIIDIYGSIQLQFIYYFLVQSLCGLLSCFGIISVLVNIFLSSPYWAFYVFDFCWYFRGVPFDRRLTTIEQCWPYFVGFGLPMSLIDNLLHPAYSAILPMFAIPFFIISAVESTATKSTASSFRGYPIHFFVIPFNLSNRLHKFLENLPNHIHSAYCLFCWITRRPMPASPPTSEPSQSRPSTPSMPPSTPDSSKHHVLSRRTANLTPASISTPYQPHMLYRGAADTSTYAERSSIAPIPTDVKVVNWLQRNSEVKERQSNSYVRGRGGSTSSVRSSFVSNSSDDKVGNWLQQNSDCSSTVRNETPPYDLRYRY